MKWNKKFVYPTSTRALIDGKRHYDVGTNEKLPSVTTILSADNIVVTLGNFSFVPTS